jgi:sialate O-acetylesterase
LRTVYGNAEVDWESAELISAVADGDKIVLTFDKVVRPDDFGSEIEGFSIADQSGIFYMANAVANPTADKSAQNKQIVVSSPLVIKPVAVRYAWARSPLGNLKVNGIPWQPLHSFRTDDIDFAAEVTHMDPDGPAKNSAAIKALKGQASAALKTRLDAQGN